MNAFVNSKVLVCALAALALTGAMYAGGVADTAKVPAERGVAAQELAAYQAEQTQSAERQARTLSAALVE
ncbi:MAG TPA: hypothetical protein VLW26_05355 [Steroidobacteraceae bacterium]|nr:hypothetical protein [Steroidobacteraceae bacterium]